MNLVSMSLLIGHGRKHRKLSCIDYESSTFLDIDPKTNPDIVIDLCKCVYRDKKQYQEIIMVCSASHIIRTQDKVNVKFLNSLYDLLDDRGKFYTSETYSRNNVSLDIFISDITKYSGLTFVEKVYKPEIQKGLMFVFQKI